MLAFHRLDGFGCDQRQRDARRRVPLEEVAVALEPSARQHVTSNREVYAAVPPALEQPLGLLRIDRADRVGDQEEIRLRPMAQQSLHRVLVAEVRGDAVDHDGLRLERPEQGRRVGVGEDVERALGQEKVAAVRQDAVGPRAGILHHAKLPHDAVAAAMRPRAAGAETEPVALDVQRILQLERLDRRGERVRHRDVHAARPVGIGTGPLPAADRLVVREALVPERDVVHRSLPLRGNVDRAAKCAHHDVDDSR